MLFHLLMLKSSLECWHLSLILLAGFITFHASDSWSVNNLRVTFGGKEGLCSCDLHLNHKGCTGKLGLGKSFSANVYWETKAVPAITPSFINSEIVKHGYQNL